MQGEGTYLAEDSCFIKHQQQQHDDATQDLTPTRNGENASLRSCDGTIAITPQPVNGTANPSGQDEKGVLGRGRRQESNDSSLASNEDEKDDFPEGGMRGWLVVLGAFCGSFSVFGIINTTAILLEYFSTHQLKENTPSQIGWIFGLALFLTFFCGAPIGPTFDAYGPRALMFAGSILLVSSMFLLGLCTRRWSPCTVLLVKMPLTLMRRVLAFHHGL